MYLLGYDIGSSSIKAGLIESATGKQVAVVSYPDSEMEIIARESGWAEQNPEVWWQNLVEATKKLLTATAVNRDKIEAIGISYQMHGLVLVDQNQEVLRPAIIWCDSRAVKIGDQAFDSIGEQTCLNTLLNSPGNFTASKLKWVKDHEPEVYARIHKAMLPGDYIAMKLTGKIATTISGLSEGIFWDFQQKEISQELMEEFGFDMSLLPDLVETIGNQGELNSIAADRLSLPLGTPVAYRGGDQPNNAMTLNVLMPGEVAATCGTSGVVYGVIDKPIYDQLSRVNSFAHVNYNLKNDRIGVLLCINGAASCIVG
jgi:xylulokinase